MAPAAFDDRAHRHNRHTPDRLGGWAHYAAGDRAFFPHADVKSRDFAAASQFDHLTSPERPALTVGSIHVTRPTGPDLDGSSRHITEDEAALSIRFGEPETRAASFEPVGDGDSCDWFSAEYLNHAPANDGGTDSTSL
jgi:hypothetical protein